MEQNPWLAEPSNTTLAPLEPTQIESYKTLSPKQRDAELLRLAKKPLGGHTGRRRLAKTCALLDAGADVQCTDPSGQSVLHLAVRHQPPRLVQALLARGARIDATDPGGSTCLHHAAAANSPAIGLLLAHGADVNVSNAWGRRPLHYAVDGRNPAVALRLIVGGAIIDGPALGTSVRYWPDFADALFNSGVPHAAWTPADFSRHGSRLTIRRTCSQATRSAAGSSPRCASASCTASGISRFWKR